MSAVICSSKATNCFSIVIIFKCVCVCVCTLFVLYENIKQWKWHSDQITLQSYNQMAKINLQHSGWDHHIDCTTSKNWSTLLCDVISIVIVIKSIYFINQMFIWIHSRKLRPITHQSENKEKRKILNVHYESSFALRTHWMRERERREKSDIMNDDGESTLQILMLAIRNSLFFFFKWVNDCVYVCVLCNRTNVNKLISQGFLSISSSEKKHTHRKRKRQTLCLCHLSL